MTRPPERHVSELSDRERHVLDLSGDFWNAFLELRSEHPSDQTDVMFHLHAIQNIILARPAQRALRLEETLRRAAELNAEMEKQEP